MKNIAVIFPGQGSQYVGMGKDFYEMFPAARKVYDDADRILGYKLSEVIFNGPQEELNLTLNSQLSIFITTVAILDVLESEAAGFSYDVCAGLSLGECTALVASKKISFEEGLLFVKKRAQFMLDACEKEKGTMAAVLGMNVEDVENVISEFSGVWIANLNCPGQIVISGKEEKVVEVAPLLKERGAKKVIFLKVQGAFHSPLMKEVENKLYHEVENLVIKDSFIAIVMNSVGEYITSKDQIKKLLVKQVTHKVLWEKSIRNMEENGVKYFIEIGPGKTLAGMNKKIKIEAQTFSIEKVEDLRAILGELNVITG